MRRYFDPLDRHTHHSYNARGDKTETVYPDGLKDVCTGPAPVPAHHLRRYGGEEGVEVGCRPGGGLKGDIRMRRFRKRQAG